MISSPLNHCRCILHFAKKTNMKIFIIYAENMTRVAAWLGWDPRMRAVMNSDNFSMANTIRAIISNFRFFFIFCSFFSLCLSFSNSICLHRNIKYLVEKKHTAGSRLPAKFSLPCLYDFYEVVKHLLERILADNSWWSLTMAGRIRYIRTFEEEESDKTLLD